MVEDADPWVDRVKVRRRLDDLLASLTPPDLSTWGEDPSGEAAALRLAGAVPE